MDNNKETPKETNEEFPNFDEGLSLQEIQYEISDVDNPIHEYQHSGSPNEAFEILKNVLNPLLYEIQISYVIMFGFGATSIKCSVIGATKLSYFFEYHICNGQYPVFARVSRKDKVVSVRNRKEEAWQEPTLETLCRLSGCTKYNPNWREIKDAKMRAFQEAQEKAWREQAEGRMNREGGANG